MRAKKVQPQCTPILATPSAIMNKLTVRRLGINNLRPATFSRVIREGPGHNLLALVQDGACLSTYQTVYSLLFILSGW